MPVIRSGLFAPRGLPFLLVLAVATAWPAAVDAVPVPSPGFPTVQAAINGVRSGALPDGTVIEVQPGTYREALTIANTTRSMTIRGVGGAGVTILDASGFGVPAVTVRNASGGIRVEGLTITGGRGGPGADTGGGFAIQGASPVFVSCVITGNTSSLHGGGGAVLQSNAVFEGTVIENNRADNAGGGVLVYLGAHPTFVGVIIRNNVSGLTSNIGAGGGVAVIEASATFRSSVVTGNQAKAAGGGIFAHTVFTAPGPVSLTLENTEVSSNTVTRATPADIPAFGGGLHVEDHVVARVIASRIRLNVAHNGGGISNHRARLDVTGSYIESNQATDPTAVGGIGGGIASLSNNPTMPLRPSAVTAVTDSVVRNNTARLGGGITSAGDPTCGGGPCNPAVANATLTLTDSLIDGNTASHWGGGVYTDRTNLTVADSQVFRNRLTGPPHMQSLGGGLMVIGSAAAISDTTIADNTALAFGGGVYVDVGTSVTIDRSNVYRNSASGVSGSRGGGIFVGNNPPATGTVRNTIIADNTNFQISEEACPPNPAPLLSYHGNVITPAAGNSDAYRSPCPPGDLTAAQLNSLPGGRASGNTSAVPVFASFKATPGAAASVLAWSVARATDIDIAGLGNNRPFPTSSQDVAPSPCTRTFVLTANSFPGSVVVSVLGTGGLAEFGPGFFAYAPGFTGGVFVAAGDVDADGRVEIITAAGAGGGPHVRAFRVDPVTGVATDLGGGFFAYHPAFTGGVFVAAGDVDGVPGAEIVTGAGAGGGPHVRVFRVNGATGAATPWAEFFAYHPAFTGGVRVAVGDVDGDGRDEVITAAGTGGGPHVRIFKIDPATRVPTVWAEFMAYHPAFTGGVFLAAADVDGDGRADVITAAGAGGGPHVRVLKIDPGTRAVTPLGEFFAYDPAFRGGVFVAAADVDATSGAEVVTGAGAGGGAHVRVFDVSPGLATLAEGFAYAAPFSGGVRVAAGDVDGGAAEIVTGAGAGGGPHVRIFKPPVCP